MSASTFWEEIWNSLKRAVLKVFGAIGSRKLWIWAVGTYEALTVAGVDPIYRAIAVAVLSVGYILGTAWEDAARAKVG